MPQGGTHGQTGSSSQGRDTLAAPGAGMAPDGPDRQGRHDHPAMDL